jgi:hypothetical protein
VVNGVNPHLFPKESAMSRAYRIRINEKLQRILRASDHVGTQLEILEILPAEDMARLLAEELERRGFQRVGSKCVRRQNGVTVEIDPAAGKVTVRAAAEEKIDLKATREAVGDEEWGQQAKKQLADETRKKLNQELQQQADKRAAELQRQVTDKLEGELADLKKELDQAVNRATAAALKLKAAQLGSIKEMTEDPQSGSLTIVVEV